MKQRSGAQVMFRLIGLVKPLTGFMIPAVIMGCIGHLCAAFITVLGGYAILAVSGNTTVSLTVCFVLIGVFASIRGILRYAEQACNHYIAFKLLALIREKVFIALRRLCPAKLEGRDKGNLITVITSDIELLEVFYAHTISPVLIAVLFGAFMCFFVGRFHIVYTGIALAAYLTLGALIPILTSKMSKDDGMRFRTGSGELSSFVLESLRGLPQLQQFDRGTDRLKQMKERTRQLSDEEKKMKDKAGLNQAATGAVIYTFDLIMITAGVLLFQCGRVDFAGVLIPVLALIGSFGPCVALADLGSTLQNTFAAGNRVLNLLDEEPVTEELAGNEEVGFSGVRIKDVSFAYEKEQVLDRISLNISKGSIVGIAGKSGSGKSTLLKLLMRFWEADAGTIEISGTDIGSINTSNLRNMESYMTQETHLFHDSIKNNIRIARQTASNIEIEEACRKASIHDFIQTLPQGYDTPVGELGETLSGGERQRLGLARAFLHDADLMLLDEPTSNLDSLNEAVILKSVNEERKNKTVVLVSHRESAMRIADTVCSVENGRMSG